MSLEDLMVELKARGNWGHEGRPGKRGGSLPKTTGQAKASLRTITEQAKRDINPPKTKTGKMMRKAEDALSSKGKYKGKHGTLTKEGSQYKVTHSKTDQVYETGNLARAVHKTDQENWE